MGDRTRFPLPSAAGPLFPSPFPAAPRAGPSNPPSIPGEGAPPLGRGGGGLGVENTISPRPAAPPPSAPPPLPPARLPCPPGRRGPRRPSPQPSLGGPAPAGSIRPAHPPPAQGGRDRGHVCPLSRPSRAGLGRASGRPWGPRRGDLPGRPPPTPGVRETQGQRTRERGLSPSAVQAPLPSHSGRLPAQGRALALGPWAARPAFEGVFSGLRACT